MGFNMEREHMEQMNAEAYDASERIAKLRVGRGYAVALCCMVAVIAGYAVSQLDAARDRNNNFRRLTGELTQDVREYISVQQQIKNGSIYAQEGCFFTRDSGDGCIYKTSTEVESYLRGLEAEISSGARALSEFRRSH